MKMKEFVIGLLCLPFAIIECLVNDEFKGE